MKKFFSNLAYLLLGLPLGLLYFVVLVTGFALGAGLLITVIGAPLLVTMIFIAYSLADLDRAITSNLLGIRITKPEARPSKENSAKSILTAQVKNPGFWKGLLYLVLKLPLGILSFSLAVTLISLSLSLLAAPIIVTWFQGTDYMVFGNLRVDTMGSAMLVFAIGLAFSAMTVPITNMVSSLLGKVTGWALG